MLILNFVNDYFKNLDVNFKLYKADIINSYNISSQEFDKNIESYLVTYKKSLRPYKFIDICKILFVFTLFVIIIVALFHI